MPIVSVRPVPLPTPDLPVRVSAPTTGTFSRDVAGVGAGPLGRLESQ